MEIRFSKKYECEIDLWCDFTNWGLPLNVNWQNTNSGVSLSWFSLNIMILCFGISFGIWKWGDKCEN